MYVAPPCLVNLTACPLLFTYFTYIPLALTDPLAVAFGDICHFNQSGHNTMESNQAQL